ncbi:hypothetical protein JCM11251_006709 [Rhodosporidiobolus azoricus]
MPHWLPPYPLCSASQKESFAYESTVKRWPIILTGVVDEIARINHELAHSTDEKEQQKVEEGKKLINQIGELVYEMRHDRELKPLEGSALPNDLDLYNSELAALAEKGQNRWFSAPWLFAECYLYRRLHLLISSPSTPRWHLFDPFQSQKVSTWRSSASGAAALAKSLQSLHSAGPVQPKDKEDVKAWEKLRIDFLAIAEACLWGNATDLSLLTSLSHDEIKTLQSVERGQAFLLKNDFQKVWEHVKGLKEARVDLVLDNSGFELFTDLVLADWLVSLSPSLVKEVVIHPKLVPWFVSDVQPHDFVFLLSSLSDPSFFPTSGEEGLSTDDREALNALAKRWRQYVDEGKFRLSVPEELKMGEKGGEIAEFWTAPSSFCDLPVVAPQLLSDLQKSSLVIFKGDLNYRKLVSDAWWPTATAFSDALGPLAGKFPILSLRTCKADTVVGLDEGVEERVQKEDEAWRRNGKYAVVSFCPKDASA